LTGNLKDGWRDYAARLDVPGKVPSIAKGAAEQHLAAWSGGPLKKSACWCGLSWAWATSSCLPARSASWRTAQRLKADQS